MVRSRFSLTIAVFAVGLATLAVGCGGSSSSSSSPATGEESSSTSESGGGELGKVAIVLTNPENSTFGQTAVNAAKQIESELGNEVTVQGGLTPANEQQTFEGYAERGTSLLIMDGAELQQAAEQVAPKYPETDFVVVNGNAEGAPNLSSATYSWEEVGFLAGVVAGTATNSNHVGQMSCLEIPPIEGVWWGFKQGVEAVNPKATAINSYTGSVTDTGKAASGPSVQASQGVDTVFTVVTGGDPGVFSAARDKNVKVIGYAIDEAPLGESVILTSALVDYEGTMVEMAKKFNEGTLKPTVYQYGLKDNAFSLAPVTNVPASTAKEIEKVGNEVIEGKFKIKPFK